MPERLERMQSARVERFLECKTVLVSGAGPLSEAMARTLSRAGANSAVASAELAQIFAPAAEAYARPTRLLLTEDAQLADKAHALMFDASAVSSPIELKALYNFFHTHLGRLARSGRIVVLARPVEEARTVTAAAASAALEGFIRSLAKEVGRAGATANLVYAAAGSEARLPAVLRFLLSGASAFVTAQPLRVNARAAWDDEDPCEQPLANRVALVTGAARGIGEATARALAAEGAHVVCLDRPEDDDPLSHVVRAINGSSLLIDISEPDAGMQIARELKARHGGVDIVVHNAGITRDRRLLRMPESSWDQVLGINLQAVLLITDALLSQQALRDRGRVVSLSSVSGIAGNLGQTNYAASKAGVIGFTRFLAEQLAGRGITVNAVAPGFIETRMTQAVPVLIREAGRRLSALGQGGLPEDVAQTIAFLAEPGAAGLSGQVLRVCGGALIGA
jgi:3-oxoacyl-[acyl-carrier protein] reductase